MSPSFCTFLHSHTYLDNSIRVVSIQLRHALAHHVKNKKNISTDKFVQTPKNTQKFCEQNGFVSQCFFFEDKMLSRIQLIERCQPKLTLFHGIHVTLFYFMLFKMI